MVPLLPTPADGDSCKTSDSRRREDRRRRRQQMPIPSVDEILQMLRQLLAMQAARFISAKDASALNRTLQTMLSALKMKWEGQTNDGASHEALVESCRRHKDLINSLAILLTEDEFDALMKEVTEDPDE